MDLSKTGVYHDLDLYDPSEHQFVNEQGSSLDAVYSRVEYERVFPCRRRATPEAGVLQPPIGGRMEKNAAGYLSLLSQDRLKYFGTSRTSPAAYPTVKN